jgi:hypothetical protein
MFLAFVNILHASYRPCGLCIVFIMGFGPYIFDTIGVSTLPYDVSSACGHSTRFILALWPLCALHNVSRPSSMRCHMGLGPDL